ncbi:MAG: hypothetical protein ACE5HT_15205 [Gemmatimonadales bacterium]
MKTPSVLLASLGLMVATSATAVTQVRVSDVEIGAFFGVNTTNGEIEDERIGAQVLVPVLGPIELHLFNLLDGNSAVGVNQLFGLNVRLP